MTKDISHPCNFCGKPVKLTTTRTFKCACGMTYTYLAPKHRPGKGYTKRQAEKVKK